VVLDPGVGFAKTSAHSLAVLAALPRSPRSVARCSSARRASGSSGR
jgi:dihydropteroate synthase